MFWFRDSLAPATGDGSRGEVAFTDGSLDLQGTRPAFAGELDRLERACGVRFARINQVHGDEVLAVDAPAGGPGASLTDADALVTAARGVGLMVRAADCVPVVLLDPAAGVAGVAHAGRGGMALGVVTRTVEAMQRLGADPAATTAWIGPHVCGRCYEVPAAMRDEVAAVVPESPSRTSWGTPALDLGAGVRAQLGRAGVVGVVVTGGCTRADGRLPSYRRDGADAGRLAGLAWLA